MRMISPDPMSHFPNKCMGTWGGGYNKLCWGSVELHNADVLSEGIERRKEIIKHANWHTH